MLEILIHTFLLSISPFGEARAGIPYAVLNGVHFGWAFLIGTIANILIYPLFMWMISVFNKKLWPIRLYKKGVIKLSRRAKKGVGESIQKYSFWGLMIFVMVPFPGTGAYMGTIAAYVMKIERKKAFVAITIGVIVSSLFMAVGSHFGNMGLELFTDLK